MSRPSLLFVFFLFIACKGNTYRAINDTDHFTERSNVFETVKTIPPPAGYERIPSRQGTFGEWLSSIRLKKDNHVYLYNGSLKKNQSVQFAVLDIPVGKKDLQQCADAVMRMRAGYLFDEKRYTEIVFNDNNGKPYAWKGGSNKLAFENYLENVFGWCGTASLEKQLKPVIGYRHIQHGDVFIKGGFPGHAMIVVDIAVNNKGQKIFMLAQSYMPAQDIHIVKNPVNEKLSPWYELPVGDKIITPEWVFSNSCLRKW
ncbi:MAG: DUF4846 domain-containing protein [Chitinophagaceae bacterium]